MRYQPHIRCNIAYTPWPIALHYLFLPQQHYIFCPSVYPTFSLHGHGPSRSLSGLWVNPFSRWVVRLYCHNPYVPQLVKHLRTRTPMGDLIAGGLRLHQPFKSCPYNAFLLHLRQSASTVSLVRTVANRLCSLVILLSTYCENPN